MKFPYFELVKKSWEISWKYKILWVFGLFAPAGYIFPNFNLGFNLSDIDSLFRDRPELPLYAQKEAEKALLSVWQFFYEHWAIVFILFFLLFLLLLFIQIITWLSKPALIKLVEEEEREGHTPTLKEGFLFGLNYLVPYVLSGWIIWLPYLLLISSLIIGVIASVFFIEEKPLASLSTLSFFLLLIGLLSLLSIPLSILTELVHRQVVIEKENPLLAIKHGFKIFLAEWKKALLIWFISLIISLMAGFVLLFALLPLILILFGLGFFLAALPSESFSIHLMAPLFLLFILFIFLLSLFLKAVSGTLLTNFWTLAYLEIQKIRKKTAEGFLAIETNT